MGRFARVVLMLVVATGAACGNDGGHGARETATPTPTITPPSAERLSGVYDGQNGALAIVSGTGSALHIVIGSIAETAVDVSGAIGANGSVALAGDHRNQDIAGPPISGRVQVSEADGELRIIGTIDGADIVLTRPAQGIARDISGDYVLELTHDLAGLDPASRLVLFLDPGPDGRMAGVPDITELDGDGNVLGTLSGGTCFVSPSHRFSCRFRYERVGDRFSFLGSRYDVVLTGSLHPFEDMVLTNGGIVATNVPPITTHVVGVAGWTGFRFP